VLTSTGGSRPSMGLEDARFVSAHSLLGAFYLARSRVVVLGTGLPGMAPYALELRKERHHVIQVWHGIPLKRIGKLFPGESGWTVETPKYAATVCSSPADQDAMAGAFSPLPRDRVWLTGLPRNDFILGPEADLPSDYLEQLAGLRRVLNGRRLVLYAPTWRESTESLRGFTDEEQAQIACLMEKHDAVLGIRGHSNVREASLYSSGFREERIVSMNDYPDVNLLLRETEVLVTDYSSIYIDFLLMDRPVVHFAYDLEAYVEERGFIYAPSEAFAGPNARTVEELMDLLDTALSSPEAFSEFRAAPKELFHSHAGAGAGRRVAENIKRLLEEVPQ
jgi:CDP-glycerol glycerophosphotransferase (TagB/SpsB family)